MGGLAMGGGPGVERGGDAIVADSNRPSADDYNDYRKAARRPKTDPNDSNDRKDPNNTDSNSTQP